MDSKILPPEGSAFLKIGSQVTLVDADMVEELSRWVWFIAPKGYARGYLPENGPQTVPMHRVVNKTPKGKHTDHINRVKLDNRRCNLRTCTARQNTQNVGARGAIPYKGVHTHRRGADNKLEYASHIRINGKLTTIGYFDTAEAAARAYDNVARDLHGEFAVLNFP